jgi:ATP-dependent RNA circularization protein (DNA/RNA ligase family)
MSEEDKRKDEIIQRIQKREKERKEKEEERKATSKQETEQEDSVKFWKDFSDLKNCTTICKLH